MIFDRKTLFVLGLVACGCSSTGEKGTLKVARYSGDDSYRRSYYDYDRSYAPPAYDRSETILPPEAPAKPPSAGASTQRGGTGKTVRPVAMPASRHDITLSELRNHVRNRSAVLVDAREPREFAKGHVPGAVNLPADEIEAHFYNFQREVGPDELVIIYCGGAYCPDDDDVYRYLSAQGYANLRIYEPGWMQLSRIDFD